MALPGLEYPHGAVVGARDELLAGRRVVDVHDGGHVVLEHVERAVHLAHVEYVDVVVLAGRGKVEGLHGVPADLVGAQLGGDARERRARAQVVQDQRAVAAGGREDRRLALVEAHGGDGVGAPLHRRDGLLARPVPDVDDGRRGRKVAVVAVVRDGVEGAVAKVRGQRRVVVLAVGGRVPHLDGAVARARQQARVAAHGREAQALDDALVRLDAHELLAVYEVPDLDLAVAGAGGNAVEAARVLGEAVDTVDVAVAELGDEGLCKHALHLGGRQRTRVFARLLERMQFGVQVAGLHDGIGARGVVGVGRPGEGFDFLRIRVRGGSCRSGMCNLPL